MLEGLSLIEVLHTIKHPCHHLASLLFLEQVLPEGVPQRSQTPLPVLINHLLVASTKVQSDLRPLEPKLDGPLALHIVDRLLESLLTDTESFQDPEHLFHSVMCFAEPTLLDAMVSSDMLLILDP